MCTLIPLLIFFLNPRKVLNPCKIKSVELQSGGLELALCHRSSWETHCVSLAYLIG